MFGTSRVKKDISNGIKIVQNWKKKSQFSPKKMSFFSQKMSVFPQKIICFSGALKLLVSFTNIMLLAFVFLLPSGYHGYRV